MQKGSWLQSRTLVSVHSFCSWTLTRGEGCLPQMKLGWVTWWKIRGTGTFCSQSSLYLLQIFLILYLRIPLSPLMPYRKTSSVACLPMKQLVFQWIAICPMPYRCFLPKLRVTPRWPWILSICTFSSTRLQVLEIYVIEKGGMAIVYMFSHRWLSIILPLQL